MAPLSIGAAAAAAAPTAAAPTAAASTASGSLAETAPTCPLFTIVPLPERLLF